MKLRSLLEQAFSQSPSIRYSILLFQLCDFEELIMKTDEIFGIFLALVKTVVFFNTTAGRISQ